MKLYWRRILSEHKNFLLKGIIFDMGDILYDASIWRRWLVTELKSYKVEIDYDSLVSRWEILLEDVYRGRASYWRRFEKLLEDLSIAGEKINRIKKAAQNKAKEVQKNRRVMKGVLDTLERLSKRKIKMAVLSDNESGSLGVYKILSELKIDTYFDAVLTSADIGYVKPDPQAYRLAASAIELPLTQCAFVGHDIDELKGALKLGLFTIAYNYHKDAPASIYIKDFTELDRIASQYSK